MVAIKPKKFSETYENEFSDLTDTLGEIIGTRLFHCGNCSRLIQTEKNHPRQKFCAKCGIEIDWVDFFIKIIKIGPTCNQIFEEQDVFCTVDGSKLEESPIEKQ